MSWLVRTMVTAMCVSAISQPSGKKSVIRTAQKRRYIDGTGNANFQVDAKGGVHGSSRPRAAPKKPPHDNGMGIRAASAPPAMKLQKSVPVETRSNVLSARKSVSVFGLDTDNEDNARKRMERKVEQAQTASNDARTGTAKHHIHKHRINENVTDPDDDVAASLSIADENESLSEIPRADTSVKAAVVRNEKRWDLRYTMTRGMISIGSNAFVMWMFWILVGGIGFGVLIGIGALNFGLTFPNDAVFSRRRSSRIARAAASNDEAAEIHDGTKAIKRHSEPFGKPSEMGSPTFMATRTMPNAGTPMFGMPPRSTPMFGRTALKASLLQYADDGVTSESESSDSEPELMPETPDDLRRILAEHKIDCSAWGTNGLKTVDDLCAEVKARQCRLRSEAGGAGGRVLYRDVRLVQANVGAATSEGVRWLRHCGEQGFQKGKTMYAAPRLCSRQVKLLACPEVAVQEMLTNELGLSSSWQCDHLALEKIEMKPSQEIEACAESLPVNRFPGLCTRFQHEVRWMRVTDVNALGCSGIIGLPLFDDFETEEVTSHDTRTCFWSWKQIEA